MVEHKTLWLLLGTPFLADLIVIERGYQYFGGENIADESSSKQTEEQGIIKVFASRVFVQSPTVIAHGFLTLAADTYIVPIFAFWVFFTISLCNQILHCFWWIEQGEQFPICYDFIVYHATLIITQVCILVFQEPEHIGN